MLSDLRRPQTPEEAALIRSVVAEPDSDTPRLVYADWLEEHGRAERAELIRTQCDLVRLQDREKTLLEQHGSKWIEEEWGRYGEGHRFHRGFPEEVSLHFKTFMAHHQELEKYTPVSRLHLRGRLTDNMDDDLTTLAKLPAVHQIRSLELDEPGIEPPHSNYGPKGIQALAASLYLKQLQQLRLHSQQIRAEGASIIANSPTFQNLTHLILTGAGLHAEHLDVGSIIRSPYLNRLQELQLGPQDNPNFPPRQYGAHALKALRESRQSSGQTPNRTP
jgi:uncharacterized protein (TIGR02996 family)